MSVIYEKHYPHPTFEEEMKELEEYKKEVESSPNYKPEPVMTFDEFYKKMVSDRTLILIPERMKGSEEFVKLAIETSELYELDTKITRKDSHIAVNYSFDCPEAMDFLMVQIKILNEDYREKYRDYPIHNIQSRIKEKESIVEKLRRKELPQNFEESDVYHVADQIKKYSDMICIRESDYIKNPKPNGYKSYHIYLGSASEL